MRRNYILFFALMLAVYSIQAQITVTTADAPSIGMVRYQANDTMPATTVQHGNAGTNQTWTFSGLTTRTLDTMNFVAPSSTPYASFYPTANLVVRTRMNNQPAYYYLLKDNTGLYALGVVGVLSTAINSQLKVTFIPKMSFLRTPSSYQSNFTETYHYTIKTTSPPAYSSYGDSIKVSSWINVSSNIDGWGSITTPGGTFNALRQYERDINHDTISFRNSFIGWFQMSTSIDTSDMYKWWTNSIGYAIADLKMNLHQNKTKSFGWYISQPTITEQLSMPSILSVYPNPVADRVYIDNLNSEETYSIKVFDLIGKEIQATMVTQISKAELTLQNLTNGIYFITVFENNKKVVTEKIILNR